MSSEILKHDENYIRVLSGISDDADQDITMLRVDPITKRLLIKADLSGYLPLSGGTLTGDLYLTSNKIIGGTTTTSDLYLQTTSGVGTIGADMHFLVGNNGGTEAMTILNSGNVGIGTTGPGAALDVASGNLGLVIGAVNGGSTRTDATNKVARIGTYHYTNAEEPVAVFHGDITSTYNAVNIGGGSSLMNSATQIGFFTGATTTTTTGTERMRITSAGNVGIGTTSPTAVLHLKASTSTAGTGSLKIAAGTLLATPEAGVVEFDGSNWYLTV